MNASCLQTGWNKTKIWIGGGQVIYNTSIFGWQPFPNTPWIPMKYQFWSFGQPDLLDTEACLQFALDYSWNNVPCNSYFCVLCEMQLNAIY